MKRLFSLLVVILLFGLGIHAQQAELKKAALNRYKNVSTLAAQVKMTRHNAALTQDVVSKGYSLVKDNKAKRRMMYTSCVVTIDMKTAEIRTLCIHERAGNYTQYDFSNYVLNKEISNSMFNPQIVKKQ